MSKNRKKSNTDEIEKILKEKSEEITFSKEEMSQTVSKVFERIEKERKS